MLFGGFLCWRSQIVTLAVARGACQAHTGLREIDEADLKLLGLGKILLELCHQGVAYNSPMVSHDEPMIRTVANMQCFCNPKGIVGVDSGEQQSDQRSCNGSR